MSPDPKTVREIATEHILDDVRRAHDIGAAVLGHYGPDALTKHQYSAYCSAIREAIRTAQITVEWPDEQQPADVVTAEQRDGAVEEVRTFLDTLPPRIDIVADWTRNGVRNVLIAEALRAVLAERAALAARVAELRDEREADTQAVMRCQRAKAGPDAVPAMLALDARFADRIAALDADTDGGAA